MQSLTRVNTVLLFLLTFLIALSVENALACCVDDDGDGYGVLNLSYCPHPGLLDCDDDPADDPAVCATDTCLSCGPVECAPCAKCIHPGATEICDGIDNNCNDVIDEDPDASAGCNDGVICTVDTCDAGTCTNTPSDALCDDGLWCTGQETCDPAADCQPSTAPCPDDGNDCTDESCNEAGQSCEYSCNATGYEDPCCQNQACLGDPVCEEPVCGNGVIEPPQEQCEPGVEPACPQGSPFCVNCICSPIAVELSYFDATGLDLAVRITWGTEAEIDNAGFNILRSDAEDGVYEQINPGLIAAEGGPTWPADYQYTDGDVVNGTTYWYKLEDVDIYGGSALHGPVSATPGASAALWSAATNAQASAVGSPGSESANYFYLLTLPLLFIGVRLWVLAYRGKR